MLADQYKYPYIDSSMYISWIKKEVVADASGNIIDRGAIAHHVIKLAESGIYRIGNSTITIAEVVRKRGAEKLSGTEDDEILRFFEQDFMDFIDIDRNIAEEANRLCRQLRLRPNDAIHLAAALRLGCDVLLAWDGDLVNVRHPNIRTEQPQMLGQGFLDERSTSL